MKSNAARRLAVLAVLALVIGACGSASSSGTDEDTGRNAAVAEAADDHVDEAEHSEDADGHGDEAEHSEVAFTFGEPAESSDADRTIEVDANDSFSFGPDNFEVSVGETIQFVITNSGSIPHDFTIGDQAAQDAHEAEMAEGGMHHGDPNAVILEPGETKSLTWTFTEAGTVLIGCHQPGHYAGGMTGTIEAEA